MTTEHLWRDSWTRRQALNGLAGFLAGSPFLKAQEDPFRDHSRVPGMDELVTPLDFEPVAFAKLPREAYDYTALGVETEFTLRRNRQAFDWVELVPRALAGVGDVNTSLEILGVKMAFPIMVAPTAGHGALHPQGELATHRGATAASNTPMIVSINASFPVDKIAEAATGPLWWQLYARDTLAANRELIERAQDSGYRAVALTVDSQYNSYRERSLHDRNLSANSGAASRRRPSTAPPPNPYGINPQTPWVDWKLVDDLRTFTKVPLLLKGILTGEDAALAVKRGADGLIVSNHGARYLDYGPSTLEVLPEIVDAVGGRIPVLIDSGFRRGSDVLKALAIGAKAVCLGRVPRWGLGAYGQPGVQRVLEIMQKELVASMQYCGYSSLESVTRKGVRINLP